MRLGDQANFKRPQVIDVHMSSLRTLASAVSKAASILLSSLSSSLKLQSGESLQSIYNTHLPSLDLVRLLKYHRQPLFERGFSHIPHTDLDSLIFLFIEQFGLQILSAESEEWEWVQPREGCVIVNVGDCPGLLTNKTFRSCQHRVKPLSRKAMKKRFSFAYFIRLDENAFMRVIKSSLISEMNN